MTMMGMTRTRRRNERQESVGKSGGKESRTKLNQSMERAAAEIVRLIYPVLQ